MPVDGFQVTRPITARLPNAGHARATLTVYAAPAALGALALFRTRVAETLAAASPSVAGVVAMFRTRVAAALETLDPSWTVHPVPVDAIEPPAYMLSWYADPYWLTPGTHCTTISRLSILVVAHRLDIEGTYLMLETMVEAAYNALNGDGFPIVGTLAPEPVEFAQITYLSARMILSYPLQFPGGN
jgi:hypothetical protein